MWDVIVYLARSPGYSLDARQIDEAIMATIYRSLLSICRALLIADHFKFHKPLKGIITDSHLMPESRLGESKG